MLKLHRLGTAISSTTHVIELDQNSSKRITSLLIVLPMNQYQVDTEQRWKIIYTQNTNAITLGSWETYSKTIMISQSPSKVHYYHFFLYSN
jgi:hypothetical protein